MASLNVRDIDDGDLQRFAAVARANKRSVAAEVRHMIAEHPRKQNASEAVAALLEFRKKYPIKLPPSEDAVSLIRAIRDE